MNITKKIYFSPTAKFKRNNQLFVWTISAVFMNDWRRLCGNRIKLYSAKSSSKTGWTLRFVWNKGDKKNTPVPPTLDALTCRRLKGEELGKVNLCAVTSHQPHALAGCDGGGTHMHTLACVEASWMKDTSLQLFSVIMLFPKNYDPTFDAEFNLIFHFGFLKNCLSSFSELSEFEFLSVHLCFSFILLFYTDASQWLRIVF